MTKLLTHIVAFIKDEEGASSIEYALIATLIALVVGVGAKTLGVGISDTFNTIATKLKAAVPTT